MTFNSITESFECQEYNLKNWEGIDGRMLDRAPILEIVGSCPGS